MQTSSSLHALVSCLFQFHHSSNACMCEWGRTPVVRRSLFTTIAHSLLCVCVCMFAWIGYTCGYVGRIVSDIPLNAYKTSKNEKNNSDWFILCVYLLQLLLVILNFLCVSVVSASGISVNDVVALLLIWCHYRCWTYRHVPASSVFNGRKWIEWRRT